MAKGGGMENCQLRSNHQKSSPSSIHLERPAHRNAISSGDVCGPTGYGWSVKYVLRPLPLRKPNHSVKFGKSCVAGWS